MTCFLSSSPEETLGLGEEIATALRSKQHATVALWGECGSGKTHLAKGIISSLTGLCPDSITSPTFSLLHTYQTPSCTIHHFDLYRLKREEEFFLAGFDEHLAEEAICLIEWPDLIAENLPETTLHIRLTSFGPTTQGRSIAY